MPEPLLDPAWESAIPPMREIWKTMAKNKYRLEDEDLKGHVHNCRYRDGSNIPIILYLERTVQIIAWRRYGGPAEYWKVLKSEYDAYMNQHNNPAGFRIPHDYEHGRLYALDAHPPPTDPPLAPPLPPPTTSALQATANDPYVAYSNTLARAKEELPAWVWAEANAALDADYGLPTRTGILRFREDAMHLLAYLRDADFPRPEVANVPQTLSDVLAHAPKAPSRGSVNWGSPAPGLEFVTAPQGNFYEWKETYLEELFNVLHDLVSSGLPGNDWPTLCWAVYDKYAQSLGRGWRYNGSIKDWSNYAFVWLDDFRYEVGSGELEESLRGRCAAGQRFNALLPPRYPFMM